MRSVLRAAALLRSFTAWRRPADFMPLVFGDARLVRLQTLMAMELLALLDVVAFVRTVSCLAVVVLFAFAFRHRRLGL
jgi:hypothetical protein